MYCIIYLFIYFAFVTGAQELIAKLMAKERNPLLLLLLLEVQACVCHKK